MEYTSKASGYLARIPGFENIGSQGLNFPDAVGGLSYDDLVKEVVGKLPNPPNGGIPGISGVVQPQPQPQVNPQPSVLPGISP